MANKVVIIILSIVAVAVVATGVGVLTWWLLQDDGEPFETVVLDAGNGFGQVPFTAAFTKIRNAGDLFWWFYPSTGPEPTTKGIILWLDGVLGTPPSFLANLGMFGPFDINMRARQNSWIESYNLLFVDAPLGTGYSSYSGAVPAQTTLEEQAEHLQFALTSFYSLHESYNDTSLYIFGQGQGAQLAVALAKRLHEVDHINNPKGVVIGNGFISPAQTLTKLGLYLEELGYVDEKGRSAIEGLSANVSGLVSEEKYEEAYESFTSLGDFINAEAGAIAVNLGHIVQKLTREPTDLFGKNSDLKYKFGDINVARIMNEQVAPGIRLSNPNYDGQREAITKAFGPIVMKPIVETVEYLLGATSMQVVIYNGNLDAVSNTPGQLTWVENLQWPGQENFTSSQRIPLGVNGLLQGYFKETKRLKFYWINAAGLSVPLDSPDAMRTVLTRIMG